MEDCCRCCVFAFVSVCIRACDVTKLKLSKDSASNFSYAIT